MNRRENAKYARIIKQQNKCEICGNSRNLEVHHIIPLTCAISGVDLNDDDNLIVLCNRCHSVLTPKKMLTKYGQHKKMEESKLGKAIVEDFYTRLEECADDHPEIRDICDIFDDVIAAHISWSRE